MRNYIRTPLLLLATCSAALAQLTVTTIPKSTLATEMSSDVSFQTLLATTLYTPQNTADGLKRENFTFNSASLGQLHFNLMGVVDPLPAPQVVVNPSSISLPDGFVASFVTEVKDDTNNFGANNGGGLQPIFLNYDSSNPATVTTSRLVQNNGGSDAFSFYDRNVTRDSVVWTMDDELHFLVYQSTEMYFGSSIYLLAIEDRLDVATRDYNDGVFIIQHPGTNPPVPEPSTYGIFGAAALLGLAVYRRRLKAKAAA